MGEVRAVYLPVLSELVRTVLISGAPSMVVFECQIRRAADEQVGSARKSRRFGPRVERSVFRATKVCVEQAGVEDPRAAYRTRVWDPGEIRALQTFRESRSRLLRSALLEVHRFG